MFLIYIKVCQFIYPQSYLLKISMDLLLGPENILGDRIVGKITLMFGEFLIHKLTYLISITKSMWLSIQAHFCITFLLCSYISFLVFLRHTIETFIWSKPAQINPAFSNWAENSEFLLVLCFCSPYQSFYLLGM